MTREERLAYLNSIPIPPEPPSIRRKPKPALPKLVAGTAVDGKAQVTLNLEEARATNRRRATKLLAEEKRQLREAMRDMMDYRKRHGRFPPASTANAVEEPERHAKEIAREEARRREEAVRARNQANIDYHIEMKLFHEGAEREFRENDPLGLWH
jgi:hypothetical protein